MNNYRSTKRTSHFTEEKEQETINCQVKKLQNYPCTVYLYSRGHDQLCTSCYTNCTFHQSYTNKCYAVVTQSSVSQITLYMAFQRSCPQPKGIFSTFSTSGNIVPTNTTKGGLDCRLTGAPIAWLD